MKIALSLIAGVYIVVALLVFIMHTQMPVTFGLAVVRSVLWPVWMAGGLQGERLPMD